MSRANPSHIALSKRVFAHEAQRTGPLGDVGRSAGQVYASLSGALVPIIGAAGAQAVFARSMKLARTQFPDLGQLPAPCAPLDNEAAVSQHVISSLAEVAPEAAEDAAERMLAVLLALLTSFIGESLVWQIVQKAFPGIQSNPSKESE